MKATKYKITTKMSWNIRGKRSFETFWQFFFFPILHELQKQPLKKNPTLKHYLLTSPLRFPHIIKSNCIAYMKKKDVTVIQWHNSMSKFRSSIKKQFCLPCPLYLSIRALPLILESYYVLLSVFCSTFYCSVFITAPKITWKDMLSCLFSAWLSV